MGVSVFLHDAVRDLHLRKFPGPDVGAWSDSVLAFVAFFVVICYHTIYASPWIVPPLAFYGLDMLMRMFKYRIKDATLTPVDDQMTIVSPSSLPSCIAA
jgi:hypothetical protein